MRPANPLLVLTLAAALVGCANQATTAPGTSLASAPPATTGTGAGQTPAAGPTEAERVYAQLGPGSGPDRLLAAAQEEGELTIYTSMTSDVIVAVTDAFSDAYDIDVNIYRAGSETVLQRIDQEQRASFAGNDIVETNALEMFDLSKAGYLAPFPGDATQGVVEAGRFDAWTATRFNNFVVSWNTELVPAGQEPKSWEELADPKWKGKISMEAGDFDWFLTLYTHWLGQGKTEGEVEALFSAMASNALVVKGHTVQGQLLAAGEFSVVVSNYSYLVEGVLQDGGPVAWQPTVQPVIARPNGVGLMRTAQHPAAALLFYEWMLTEGQKVIVEQGLTPSTETAGDDQLTGLEIIPVNLEAISTDAKKWEDRYQQILEEATQAGG